ncbi:MAG: hypothetical protein L6R38_007092 [Xanthoria sp. 2 TBL-2021]|nr:MAG: hypothetical protein L6R38_007092 [Xanthoria sp. 2 TBL-2021]
MPQIILDHTLREFYCQDETEDSTIVVVNALPTAETQMTRGIPLSIKYTYQSPNVLTRDPDMLARLYLQVVPQIFGFIAGDMPLILFDLDNAGQAHRNEAYQTYSQLTPGQRPQLSFVAQPSDIQLPAGARIAIANPMDCLFSLPHAVDPNVHYDLLSKKSLALSILPSPPSEVVDTVLRPGKDYDEPTLDAEIDRMTKAVTTRACPFVAKMPQSLSGEGVFLIRSDSEKHHAVEVLQQELRRSLAIMRQSKMQTPTSSIILQKLIPGENVALAFFVTRRGRAIFTSCCPQLVDPHGHWEGGYISYKQQEQFQRRYARIIELLGQYMHSKGYYGPAGADVITDHEGVQFVIDLNVRVIGSHPLGFLKNHFSVERGLHEAVLFFPLFLNCKRETFEDLFRRQLHDGALVITGWCHDKEEKTSITSMILAAEDESKLRTFIDEVKVYQVPG